MKSPSPTLPWGAVAAGLFIFGILALAFFVTGWDLDLSRLGFDPRAKNWPLGEQAPWIWLHHYGQAPAFVTGVLGGLAYLLSFTAWGKPSWRGPGLYLFVLLALGPGLFVNVLGKSLAGRPRPWQVDAFGGAWEFRRPFELGLPGRGNSFLSGHAAMAFYWSSLIFLARGKWRWAAALLTLALGGLMSAARVLQGAHWASDTLLCGAIVFSLAAFLSPLIHHPLPLRFWARPSVALALLLALLSLGVMGKPLFEERFFRFVKRDIAAKPQEQLLGLPALGPAKALKLRLELQQGDLRVEFQTPNLTRAYWPFELKENFWALATPWSKVRMAWPKAEGKDGTFDLAAVQKLEGQFFQAWERYQLRVSPELETAMSLKTLMGSLSIGPLPQGRHVELRGNLRPDSLPDGFVASGPKAWSRAGAEPAIELDLSARSVRFENGKP